MDNTIAADRLVEVRFDTTKPWQIIRTHNWEIVHEKIGFKTIDEAIEAVIADGELDYASRYKSRHSKREAVLSRTNYRDHENFDDAYFQVRYKGAVLLRQAILFLAQEFSHTNGRVLDCGEFVKFLSTKEGMFGQPGMTKEQSEKSVEGRLAKEREASKVRRTYEDLRNGRRKVARVIEKAVVHYLADCIKAREEPEPADETYLSYAGPVHVQRSRPRVPFETSDLLNAATFVHDNSFVVLTKKEYEDMVKAISEASA